MVKPYIPDHPIISQLTNDHPLPKPKQIKHVAKMQDDPLAASKPSFDDPLSQRIDDPLLAMSNTSKCMSY